MSSQFRSYSSVKPPALRIRRPGEPRKVPGSASGNGAMSRAARFEDEKRRIIRSCFSRSDSDGVCTFNSIAFVIFFYLAGIFHD